MTQHERDQLSEVAYQVWKLVQIAKARENSSVAPCKAIAAAGDDVLMDLARMGVPIPSMPDEPLKAKRKVTQ